MYEKHFGLTEHPFSIAPDPRFLYMSQQHREALAHLLYGVGEGGGFVQLTGEVGTGKTTVCRCLLEQLPEHIDIALILNPRVTALELLGSLCDELKIQYARDTTSIKSLIDVLNAYLLDSHAQGRRTVLMIDEAQNLSAEALEQVRLLTNLETTREKLLQIILVGQPELRDLLAREDLRQLSQRITARYHLEPISRAETSAYIRHRLQICGASATLFTDTAIELIYKLSAGVPRLINVLSDRAMLGAFVEGKRMVDAPIVQRAAREVLPEEGLEMPGKGVWRWLGMGAVAVLAGLVSYFLVVTIPLHEPARLAMNSVEKPVFKEAVAEEPRIGPAASEAEAPQANEPDDLSEAEIEAQLESESLAMDLRLALAQAGPYVSSRAWKSLYRLWGVRSLAVSDEQACAQAPAAGLRCLQGGGSWTVLKHFDRPALLLLVASEGRRVPVLIREVVGSQVRVQVDGRDLEVPIDELERHWFGEYRLLWKTPPSGNAALRPGDRNADVKWLRDRLAKATGLTAIAPDPLYFDAGLKELVQSFQRSLELSADGVAGARTFINLNNLDRESSVPRLGAVAVSR
ncbi:MAG: ExeA family protein [Gammaproteobacteria bacterium]|nr:MAG: ExeA family protein [Gammaproteobacteria bacterium]